MRAAVWTITRQADVFPLRVADPTRPIEMKLMHSKRHSLDWYTRLARIVAVACLLFFLGHCIWVIAGPEHRVMDWLYDDAFYYLIVASHFSRSHLSSFDGLTVTTGYHPLWMWLCSAIYGLRNQLDLNYVRLCMVLSVAISGSLLGSAVISKVRSASNGWLWTLALAATSYSALNNGLTVMEWPLVVGFWALLHLLILSSADADFAHRNAKWATISLPVAFLLGTLGSLSRTDFGLIPAAYLVAALFARRVFATGRSATLSASALVGSAGGVAITLLYNHAMTGEWLQKSAQIKQLLASVSSPFNPLPAVWQFGRVLLYLPPLDTATAAHVRMLSMGPVLAIALGIAAGYIVYTFRSRFVAATVASPPDMISTIAAVLGLAGYALFYSFNSQATYGWYTATVTGFILVLCAHFLGQLPRRVCATLVILVVMLNLTLLLIGGPNARNQYQEVVIGKQMRRDHPNAIMGGGDVGKPSFFNNGTMINTDGLMNNEAFPYLANGRYHCYILARRIEFLSDIGSIPILLTDGIRARNHQSAVPWGTYFPPIPVLMPDGSAESYNRTDFQAILASGECSDPEINPVP